MPNEQTLNQLISEAQAALQAVAFHPDYQEMLHDEFLVGLDITIPDADLCLDQLAQTYEDWSLIDDPSNE